MKRMRTMKRMVRLAVGSLSLLALMAQAAPAATSTSTAVCAYPGVEADGKTSTFTVFLFNPNGAPLTYQVGLAVKGSAPKLLSKQLAPNETIAVKDTDISPSGVTDGTILVATADPIQFVTANVFSSKGGVETAVPAGNCYTLGSGQ